MAKLVKDSQGRDCTVLEITPENKESVMELAEIKGYDIDRKYIGYRRIRAVLVPASQEVHDEIFHEEDNEQKRKRVDGRCLIKDENGKVKRCPERIKNPAFDCVNNPDVPQTIKVSCEGCIYNTLNKPDYTTESLDKSLDNEDDACEEARALTTGIMPENECYEKARIEVLAMIAEKYPDKYERFDLLLAGENRSATADELGINKSTLYKMSKELKKDLINLLENLWYLNIVIKNKE